MTQYPNIERLGLKLLPVIVEGLPRGAYTQNDFIYAPHLEALLKKASVSEGSFGHRWFIIEIESIEEQVTVTIPKSKAIELGLVKE